MAAALHAGQVDDALARARAWHDDAPTDVLALLALGDALEADHELARAARIYGSIIDLYPTRADYRRFAGERLERVRGAGGLAIDTYRKAVADRPDHLGGHRLLAYALLRDGDYADAFAAILAGVDQKYPPGRFRGGDRVLAEDAGMIAAVYAAHGGERTAIARELERRSLVFASEPSTRVVLYWETDGNDVDLHVRDRAGGHAWYGSPDLPSGGTLYGDVTTGYGPECFAIPGTPRAGPYRLAIDYFAQGPMGYGMGLVQIQRFDGHDVAFDDRPFVIMTDRASVDLGAYP
jgi:tetratricopeptide (TPR) repeat protein